MTKKEAIKRVNSTQITAWMAYGVIKCGGIGYILVSGDWIKKFGEDRCVYIRKGEAWPKSPASNASRIEIKEYLKKGKEKSGF